MASIDVAKVVISRAAPNASQWRARSFGGNGEQIAITEAYHNYADAEAAAYSISAGAEVVRDDDAWPTKEEESAAGSEETDSEG